MQGKIGVSDSHVSAKDGVEETGGVPFGTADKMYWGGDARSTWSSRRESHRATRNGLPVESSSWAARRSLWIR